MATNGTTSNQSFLGRAAESVKGAGRSAKHAAGAPARYIDRKKQEIKNNKINAFLNTPQAKQRQAADAMNSYLEANTAAMNRINVINSYNPASPNLDLETILQSLEQIASVDINNSEAKRVLSFFF